jgi:DNA-binding NarL/FixJ family response regulator
VAAGRSHKEIAATLGISIKTVSVYVIRVAAKIGADEDARPSIAIAVWWGRNRAA